MKYFITYKIKGNKELIVTGPYEEFEYIKAAMNVMILSDDSIYDLDIVNEVAMDLYNIYLAIEKSAKVPEKKIMSGWDDIPF